MGVDVAREVETDLLRRTDEGLESEDGHGGSLASGCSRPPEYDRDALRHAVITGHRVVRLSLAEAAGLVGHGLPRFAAWREEEAALARRLPNRWSCQF